MIRTYLRLHIFILLHCAAPISGNIFDSIKGAFEDAGNAIKDTAVAAGNAIADRFKDTKVTRSIDYGIRLAALEAAERVASGVLDAAEKVSSGALNVSIDTVNTGLTAAEGFLQHVVQNASTGILSGSVIATNGILEGVKQAGVGTLEGGKWVAKNVLGQFDLNKVRYEGDLKSLERGILGNVQVEGILLGKSFSKSMTLDPADMAKSVAGIAKDLGSTIKNAVYDPISSSLSSTIRTLTQAQATTERAISEKEPESFAKAERAAVYAKDAFQAYEEYQKSSLEGLLKDVDAMKEKVKEVAKKTVEELKAQVKKNEKTSTNVLSRQELAKRALQNKGG